MAQQQEASRRPAKTVVDMTFYDLLGCPADASTSALRRRFYAESLKWHPDKNPTEEAKVRFQKLNEAYQVLSDDQKRDTYDRMGAADQGGRSGPAGLAFVASGTRWSRQSGQLPL